MAIAGDDTIDISALSSAHRIVFRSNGGNDTILGTLRPQDVIELPAGATAASFTTTTNASGVSTMTDGTNSITFTAPNGMPQFGHEDDEDDEDDDHTDNDHDDDDDHHAGNDDDDCDEDTDTGSLPAAAGVRIGTPQADVLIGTAGDDDIIGLAGDDYATGGAGADSISAGEGADFVNGGDGRDVISAGAGDDQVFAGGGADIIFGDAGADRIFGDEGHDMINAGAGDDTVFGGAGDDLFVAENGDGNDVYFGHDSGGGPGSDTLDMSAVTVNATVHLGSGPLSNGTASSSQTGNDTIWGIENVNTGSGNDTITASDAVNVMNGGAGNDIFKFTSASAADGDTILGFQAGDRVDLSAIDTNSGTARRSGLRTGHRSLHRGGSARRDVQRRRHRDHGQCRRRRRCRLHDRDRRQSQPDPRREPRSVSARKDRREADVTSASRPLSSLPFSVFIFRLSASHGQCKRANSRKAS